jgi:hypothetical protein
VLIACGGITEQPTETGGGDCRTLLQVGRLVRLDALSLVGGCTIGAWKGGVVPKDERRCLLRYAVDFGGLGPSRSFPRLCGSWLEKEEDRLELGDALGVWEGGVYGIRSAVGGDPAGRC